MLDKTILVAILLIIMFFFSFSKKEFLDYTEEIIGVYRIVSESGEYLSEPITISRDEKESNGNQLKIIISIGSTIRIGAKVNPDKSSFTVTKSSIWLRTKGRGMLNGNKLSFNIYNNDKMFMDGLVFEAQKC